MEYLKKSKMHKVAKDLLNGVELPEIKRCSYEFYKGSEWLKFTVKSVKYELYHAGNKYLIKGIQRTTGKRILYKVFYTDTEGNMAEEYSEG